MDDPAGKKALANYDKLIKSASKPPKKHRKKGFKTPCGAAMRPDPELQRRLNALPHDASLDEIFKVITAWGAEESKKSIARERHAKSTPLRPTRRV